ncbi:MAG: hypothetical protein ACP59X_16870 [Solidesulfovibrio sp. DCME]|uniref:hypothetical protein n=1 Tax=Solidesulfovibrio sp. DCME TaxID=3447380 RepID=UPI003D09DAD9
MPRLAIVTLVCCCCLGTLGCTKFQPIITPQEFEASCRSDPAGADGPCAARVCAVFEAVTTDYHEDMASCQAVCRQRAEELLAGTAPQCREKIKQTREACLEFCNRKFYRCNCTK